MARFYETHWFHWLIDSFFPPSPEIRAAREADEALQVNSAAEEAAGVMEETPEFLRLNRAANAAVDRVPRGQRWRVDWRI